MEFNQTRPYLRFGPTVLAIRSRRQLIHVRSTATCLSRIGQEVGRIGDLCLAHKDEAAVCPSWAGSGYLFLGLSCSAASLQHNHSLNGASGFLFVFQIGEPAEYTRNRLSRKDNARHLFPSLSESSRENICAVENLCPAELATTGYGGERSPEL